MSDGKNHGSSRDVPGDPPDGASGDSEVLDCENAIRLLARYLDGELEPVSRGRLEDHLQRCRSCYSRHEFEKGLKDQLSRLGQEPVRPEFRDRIRGLVSRFAEAGPGAEEGEDGSAGVPSG